MKEVLFFCQLVASGRLWDVGYTCFVVLMQIIYLYNKAPLFEFIFPLATKRGKILTVKEHDRYTLVNISRLHKKKVTKSIGFLVFRKNKIEYARRFRFS